MRSVIQWPNPALKAVCQPIENPETKIESIWELATEMQEIMLDQCGVGLAANQVGDHRRVIVMKLESGGCLTLVNPVIKSMSDWGLCFEGCLSVPGIGSKVRRARQITVSYYDPESMTYEEDKFQDLDAQVIQHEVEHLDGIMFLDHLTAGERDSIRNQLRRSRL